MSEEIKVSNMFIDSLKTQEELYYKAKMKELYEVKIKDLQQKVEQLESIRKEGLEYIKTHWSTDNPTLFKNDVWDILNKGSEDNGLQENS